MIEHKRGCAAAELIIRDIEQLVGETRVHQRIGVEEQVADDYSTVIERDFDRDNDRKPEPHQHWAERDADHHNTVRETAPHRGYKLGPQPCFKQAQYLGRHTSQRATLHP